MSKILTLLKSFLATRLGMNIAGIIIVCCLAWFIGMAFHLSLITRLIIIGIIALIFIAINIFRFIWTKSRGEKLQQQLQSQGESIAGRQLEIELLKEKMAAAVNSLKASELGIKYRGNAALYALPWYIIIGPSAAGKSTLLRNSGLHFPFSSNEDLQIKGFGGTRNCDWWFADEAIILDTAGRYTTEEDDKDEWLSFLDLIKKNRPRLPINGIIIAISLKDLLTGDESNIQGHVKVIRDRIEELYSRLGFVFPLTLLFTKVDLLAGFEDFFANMHESERQQVWGINFAANYEDQLEELYAKLIQLRLAKIAVAQNLNHKLTLYNFPEQFKNSLKRINQFITLLLKINPYQETPVFQGIYFTSGTQGEESKPETLTNTSYFIKDIFQKVIFPNKYSAAKTQDRMRLQQLIKSAGIVGCAGVLGLAFMGYSTSLTNNIMLLHRGKKIAAQLANNPSMESLLSSYAFYYSLVNYQQEIPLHLRLGLYRGNREMEPLQEMLSYILQTKFLQPMGQYLTQKLTQYNQTWASADEATREKMRGDYYTTLKAYLMLSYPQRIDMDQGTTIFSLYWSQMLAGKAGINNYEQSLDTATYTGLVSFYLQHPGTWKVDSNLVSISRQQLYLAADALNLYAQITDIAKAKLPTIPLTKLLPDSDANLLVSNYQIPGIYTPTGWNQVVQPEIDKIARSAYQRDWVIDTPLMQLNSVTSAPKHPDAITLRAETKLKNELRNLYIADYRQTWLQLITQTQVRQFRSLNDANQQLSVLSSPTGPITQFLQMVATKVNIPELGQPLIDLHSVSGDPLKSYLNEVIKIQNDMQNLSANPDANHAAQQYAMQLLSGSGGNTELYHSMIAANMLSNSVDDGQTRIAVKQFLLQPIRESWRIILHTGTQGLEQQWQTQVMSDYQQNLAGRFPFSPYATDDASVSDVIDFFQPKNGLLWTFVNTYLQPFLTYNLTGWQEQQWLGIGAGFSPQFLAALTQAKAISSGLFSNGGNQPGFTYRIYPNPTPSLSQIILTTDGKNYRYSNGPQEWQGFNWSGNTLGQDSYLSAVASQGANPEAIQASGVWAIFHLISQGKLTVQHGSTYQASWNLTSPTKTYHINMLIRSNSRTNIFQELLLNKFTLPKQLFANNDYA